MAKLGHWTLRIPQAMATQPYDGRPAYNYSGFWEQYPDPTGMLVLHMRQGFYCDPVYGGNKGRVGWNVIGFPGPTSLSQTVDGSFTTADFMD